MARDTLQAPPVGRKGGGGLGKRTLFLLVVQVIGNFTPPFPQIGYRFVSATVLYIFLYLFSTTLLLYHPFQFSNLYAMQVEGKPFLSTSIRRTLTVDIRS